MQPNPKLKHILLWGLAVLGGFGIFLLLPIRFSPNQDFSVLYYTVSALRQGIPIYDHAAQSVYVSSITPAGFEFHPFPYPPWFALAAYPLGALSPGIAAKVWAGTNLVMMLAVVWLLTDDLASNPWLRFGAGLSAYLFLPFIGLVLVGQYSMVTLLGAALLVFALPRQHLALVLLGLTLLTVKPHLGGIVMLAVLVVLLRQPVSFRWRVAGGFAVVLLALAAISALQDPAWPVHYFGSLQQYAAMPGVAKCDQCASLTGALANHIGLGAWAYPAGFALFTLSAVAILLGRKHISEQPANAIAIFSTAGLLWLPYIQRYDHTLLLVAILPIFGRVRWGVLTIVASYMVLFSNPVRWLSLPVLAGTLLIYYLNGPIDQTNNLA